MSYFESRLWNIVVDMARLEQFHQGKSHDETDRSPFEASQSGLKHPKQTLAHAPATLKGGLDLGAAQILLASFT